MANRINIHFSMSMVSFITKGKSKSKLNIDLHPIANIGILLSRQWEAAWNC